MPLNPEQEWTLVSCGMLALADRVLTGGEAARLLALVESYLDPEEQDLWMDIVCDKSALEAHFEHMKPPPESNHLAVLERVWNVALADGDAALAEIRVFEQIGARLGVAKSQLAVLRKTWTYEAMERSEVIAGFMAILLRQGGDAVSDGERQTYAALVGRLPLSRSRRERILEAIDEPPEVASLGQMLRRQSKTHQLEALRSIAMEIKDDRREAARALLIELLAAAKMSASVIGDLRGFAPAQSAS